MATEQPQWFRFQKKKKTVLDWSQDSSAVAASSRPAKAPFFFLPGRREIVVGHCQCQDWASPTIMYIYIFSFIIEDKQWKLKLPTASSHQPSILLSQNWLLATFWISFGYLLSSWDNDGCSRESHITCCILLHITTTFVLTNKTLKPQAIHTYCRARALGPTTFPLQLVSRASVTIQDEDKDDYTRSLFRAAATERAPFSMSRWQYCLRRGGVIAGKLPGKEPDWLSTTMMTTIGRLNTHQELNNRFRPDHDTKNNREQLIQQFWAIQ